MTVTHRPLPFRARSRGFVSIILSLSTLATSLAAATPALAQTYRRVSEAADGTAGNSPSGDRTAISANGRWVAFSSMASNLVPGDTNESMDVFVKDVETGAIARVSLGPGGAEQTGNSGYDDLDISDDGQIVAFTSRAALVANDDNVCVEPVGGSGPCTDVYVHDRATGETTRVSVSSLGVQGDNRSIDPGLSADGRYVVFSSRATTLVEGDTNGVSDVFLHDRTTQTTTRISVTSGGLQADQASDSVDISDDGLFIGFISQAAMLDTAADPLACTQAPCKRAFLHEREGGATTRIAIDGGINTNVEQIELDGQGRWIALALQFGEIPAPAPPPNQPGGHKVSVVLHDRLTGRNTELLDQFAFGSGFHGTEISGDGRVVFGTTSGAIGVFGATRLFDRTTGVTELALGGRMTFDGLTAVVTSGDDRVPNDVNGVFDVFVAYRDSDRDGLPDAWEARFGFDPSNGGDAGIDSDSDGVTNVEEYLAGTHPKGTAKRYLAEGSASTFFKTRLAVLNPNDTPVTAVFHLLGSRGGTTSIVRTLAPNRRATIELRPDVVDAFNGDFELRNTPENEFSTIAESDLPIVVERTMAWDASGYGSHTEASVPGPSTTWHLAEGATHGAFDLFYLFQNPNDADATVTVTYLRQAPQTPVVRTYAVRANTRETIWVDADGPELESVEVAASIVSDLPIVVERAMYLSTPGQPFSGGHAGAGITQPALTWFLAEGATGDFFDLYVLVGNPNTSPAELTVHYLLSTGERFSKDYAVGAQQRLTISVAGEDPRLAAATVAVIVESTNNQPVVVERAMWWPKFNWYEGHLSAGTTETGTRWALAEGQSVEALNGAETSTYFLIANTSDTDGSVTITVLPEVTGGEPFQVTVDIAANSRQTIAANDIFPSTRFPRFGAIIESDGIPIVVERAMYSNSPGVFWSAGTSALGTKLDPLQP